MFQKSDANLPQRYLGNIRKKTLRALLVKELVFNNELVIRDIGYASLSKNILFLIYHRGKYQFFKNFPEGNQGVHFPLVRQKNPPGMI